MKLEPFHQGKLVTALFRLRVPYGCAPLLIFVAYWLIPLLFLIASPGPSTANAAFTEVNIYLQDRTHLIFASLISLGALPLYLIVSKTSPVVRHTLRVVKGQTDHAHWQAKYRKYQTAAFSRWLAAGCSVLGLLVFAILLSRVFDGQYHAWWGHISHGSAGLYFALIAALMVFSATWSLFVVAAVSVVISHIARCKFSYEPLRADGCNGLRPVGFLIMMMWGYSLLAAAAVYIVFSRGYLRLEENPAIWFVSLMASVCLPLVAVLPLVSVTGAIHNARELYLREIERCSRDQSPCSSPDIEKLNQLLEIRQSVTRGNIFPFRNQTVLLFTALNLVQVTLSARELLPG